MINKRNTWFLWCMLILITGCHKKQQPSKDVVELARNLTQGASIILKGDTIHTLRKLPPVGSQAESFTLTNNDFQDVSLSDFKGKTVILNIFPSIDTRVCATSVRKFNKEAARLKNTVILCISKDLPFAQKHFCAAEGIKQVILLSDFRSNFGQTYGVQIVDGAMRGILSRAVIVINPEGKIIYEEQVPDIAQEPRYEKALQAINNYPVI